jgi:hypothetical protein
MLPVLSQAKGHNYKYVYKPACNCFISKNNPNGIERVVVATYTSDPDVHMTVGFHHTYTPEKTDTVSLTDFSPRHFQCQPCAVIQPGVKYVLYFEGKPGMDQVEVKLHKDEKGKVVIDK